MHPSQSALTSIPPWLVLMGLLTAIGPLAIDMYLPAFSAITHGLGAEPGQVERTLASYLLGLATAQLFYGPLADRYGRKKPLALGLIIFTIASIGCAYTDSIEHLTFWRIAQAFGGAAGIVIPRAVIRDNYDTRDASKALSLLMLIMGVTPILAPILGGQILIYGSWRGIFAVMTTCSALLLIAVVFTMRETLKPERVLLLGAGTIARNYLTLLGHKRFMCYTLAGGFGAAGMFAYIAGSPHVFLNVYGIDPRYFGLLFGANAAALIFAAQVSARLLNRHTPETLLRRSQRILLGVALVAVALTLLDLINLPLLMICLMSFMASQGFVNPNSAALALREQGQRLGFASAMMGTLQMLCGAAAGLAVSLWQSPSPLSLTTILALCACLSWLFGRIALKSAQTT
ncbi:multidrug effflux MFS transporter [Pusillimonas sp. MFBS29]|uniref:multidrug effflux MFS transporter n=1 Tax=Pusillimonas sp. MFBS29 TaxID=2886690 RepID=UPI001D12A725|nr:multidrug effflux MFS transporter [Pusillimonas sp. MFBS29]MCC2595201.1 multidrug effflux MFS transporter [Pusillimonas sp. MFBS29]